MMDALTKKRLPIRADLVRVARLKGLPEGYAPSRTMYEEHGRYSKQRVLKLGAANSWSPAVQRYGLRPLGMTVQRVTRDEALEDVRRVTRELGYVGRICTQREYRKHGRWTEKPVCRALDAKNWKGVAKACVLPASWTRGQLTTERIVADIRECARALGYTPGGPGPSSREFSGWVRYGKKAVRHRLAWNDAVRLAGFTPRASGGQPAPLRAAA